MGRADELGRYSDERTMTRDLLWYLDMSTGPNGQTVSFQERMAEVRERYLPEHYVIRALDLGMAERVSAVERSPDLAVIGRSWPVRCSTARHPGRTRGQCGGGSRGGPR